MQVSNNERHTICMPTELKVTAASVVALMSNVRSMVRSLAYRYKDIKTNWS